MANTGKIENWGSGSRRSPQRRAENSARRSQKRAGERRWKREEEGRHTADLALPPEPSTVALALVPAIVSLWHFSRDIEQMTERTDRLFA